MVKNNVHSLFSLTVNGFQFDVFGQRQARTDQPAFDYWAKSSNESNSGYALINLGTGHMSVDELTEKLESKVSKKL